MAYILKKIGNVSNIPAYHFECDNNEDILEIPLVGVPMSSTCYVINEGTTYTLNSDGEWVITMRGGTGGNGGGSAGNGNAVLYTEQELSEDQQMQARKNLGLYGEEKGWVALDSWSAAIFVDYNQTNWPVDGNSNPIAKTFTYDQIQVCIGNNTYILPKKNDEYSEWFGNKSLCFIDVEDTGESVCVIEKVGRYITELFLYVAEDLRGEVGGSIAVIDTITNQVEPKYLDSKPGTIVYDENSKKLGEIFNSSDNVATGFYSHAEGTGTKATGDSCHAEGEGTTAGGLDEWGYKITGAHAEGYSCEASGSGSHAEGWFAIASGNSSHAEGFWTVASGWRQHVQGSYNIEDTEDKYAHIVGNGDDDDKRSNAHTLDWDGNAWYAGYVESKHIILTSPNGTRFKVTVSDSGTLSATQVTE